MNAKSYDTKKHMTVAECLEASGYANAYFRMKVLKLGKIPSIKEMIPGTQIPRILVDRAAFEQWMKDHPRGERTPITEDMKKVLRDAGFAIE